MLKVVKRIIDLSGDNFKRMYISFVYALMQALFSTLPVLGASYVLKLIIENIEGITVITINQVWFCLGYMIFALLGRMLFSYLVATSQESIGYEVFAEQRLKIGDALKRVPMGFFGEKDTGEITSSVTTDLSFVENNAMKLINKVVNGYISSITISLCLMFFDFRIGLITLGGIILTSLVMIYISKRSRIVAPIRQANQAGLVTAIIEYIRGISIVKAFKQDGIAKESIENAFEKSRKTNYGIEQEFVPVTSFYIFIFKLASVGIIFASAIFAINGSMEVSTMLMMITFSFIIYGHVEQIGNSSNMIRMIDASLDRVDEVKNVEPIDKNSKPVVLDSYDICFDKVSFAYDKKNVLQDVSFFIPENTTTAIVGTSGGGKSTICSLIARFYDVQQGAVSIGGVNVRDITCDSLLSNISMVFQKVYLFQDTILNNISFGNPSASIEEVIIAAKKARCHDFIMEFPDKYNTVVGEGGASLSGGQKQRISIARAILKDAPIIILDEATASVDPENEHYIQEAINALTNGKTIIIIAHRLATIQNADQILVISDGKVIQKGTHKQLINQEGLYNRFINIRKKAEGWSLAQ
ncbi:ABC transporter ATP-binding protein [Clostridium beijerinckii]|uniref:ATP-binding cassette subfamily B protein n=1 Tax=Clostridium beijerinckii TaxID=1520 RepID=A0AAX0AXW6_CLOBE|nr:ABC transporter ATP-binding protein [Clostridium beijerinckii]MBA8934422.1 ATP-binding cassette subfamily B protein [Clostridium beijerinckii]NRT35690.1 ATP-binding cassette subfamily B protein [Clostridium beijerinckii]NRT44882.1 ATP-binding cassette subfamily B protein [Clostridium beijerinckii]NRT86933.1 ATP-binding cassette subfamily B protein [Clostridium beijerinckii]NRU38609.1 ATP-binding cassette subfamily B protein [Clostridium beijerinckii]